MILLTANGALAEQRAAELRFFLGERADAPPLERRVHSFPAWDTEPLSGHSPTGEVMADRMAALWALAQARAPIVVAPAEALLQKLPPRDWVVDGTYYCVAGEEIELTELVAGIIRAGYQRLPQVEDRGEVSVRGGIVDVFPAGSAAPLRFQFDGDVLERIRAFDPATQVSGEDLAEALLFPWREASLDRWCDPAAVRAVEDLAREREVTREERAAVIDRMRQGLPFPGAPFLVPFLYDRLVTFGDYAPEETVFWIDDPAAVEAGEEAFAKRVDEHAALAVEGRRLVPEPGALYLATAEARRLRERRRSVEVEPLDVLDSGDAGQAVLRLASFTTGDVAVTMKSVPGREATLRPLVERIEAWAATYQQICLVVHDEAQASRLQGLLAGRGLRFERMTTQSFAELPKEARFMILLGDLREGFHLPEDRLVVVSGEQVFGERRHSPARRIDVSRVLSARAELRPGDPVVHINHGIGRYHGLQHLTVASTEGDYLHLEYQGGDRLYLPVDRINLVDKYVGADGKTPELDKLGGTSWEKVKAKARESVLAMAQELLEIQATRKVLQGYAFGPEDESFREFEARFSFEETPDQDRAIREVLADLRRDQPMDRLVCGDVGFGKTEVALRAAFAAAMDGKQVLVLVPTTVLARQHYDTFRARFEGFPIQIEMLSRFRGARDTKAVLEGLAVGTVDVVIGTHRVLQADVAVKDLGLLVIDEEHRFGVRDKERIKQLRKVVDVLTLTATPIPRTLHMALSGIRDLSIIETPPVDRQVIRTYVTRHDENLIREAILRELARAGQVFFVHNRVETIERVARRLAELIPEARLGVSHGKMRGPALEKVMLDFLEKRIDVLVTTAIIESGLDIPNANTIFIDRADHFGLAQLYQLRGRVGRSHQRAYAYLLIPPYALLSDDAQKRLEVLSALDDLGGGFRLAIHDLEIRGAGNLLGKQQSGQVAAVGFDLFTQMLDEVVRDLQGERVRPEVDPEIQLGIAAFIPEDYVADVNQRLVLYKRLARSASRDELDEIREELEDRYGAVPARVDTLLETMELRRHLKVAMVTRLRRLGGRLSISFHPDASLDPERLVALAQRDAKRGFRVQADHEVVFPVDRIDLPGMAAAVLGVLSRLVDEPTRATLPTV